MNLHKTLAVRALENARGDDLYRATKAFEGFTAEEMQLEHGQSGKTRAKILEEYRQHDQAISDAIDWVKNQTE